MDLMAVLHFFRNKKPYPIKEIHELERKYKEWLKDYPLPLPSEQQLKWLDAEMGMFVHFGINTYYNKEWSDGTLSPEKFNPKNLDCEQWVKVAKSFGAKYIILTTKHHDGFCLWQTSTTDYSVKSSPWNDGKGDVVREFVEACRKHDMKFGFYLSPWDRHEQKFGCYNDEKAYDKFYTAQLTELLSKYAEYNEVFEIWFDGAGSAGHKYNWDMIMGVCRKYQPDAMIFNMGKPTIRWVGNEDGLASKANWNVIYIPEDKVLPPIETFDNIGVKLKESYGLGNVWMPAECDTSIRKTKSGRKHWFYHENDEKSILSLNKLLEIYHKSVGRGANLLLNIPPNRDGLIPSPDAMRAAEFGKALHDLYSKPLHVISDPKLEQNEIILDLSEIESSNEIDCIVMEEDLSKGQRIREYIIEARIKDSWKTISSGYSIGHKKIDIFKPISAKSVKLKIVNSLMEPFLRSIKIYHIGPILKKFGCRRKRLID